MKVSRKGLKSSRKGRLGKRIAIALVALTAFLALPLLSPAGAPT